MIILKILQVIFYIFLKRYFLSLNKFFLLITINCSHLEFGWEKLQRGKMVSMALSFPPLCTLENITNRAHSKLILIWAFRCIYETQLSVEVLSGFVNNHLAFTFSIYLVSKEDSLWIKTTNDFVINLKSPYHFHTSVKFILFFTVQESQSKILSNQNSLTGPFS